MRDDLPDLMQRWARGWASARELSVREVERGLRIDVGATSRRWEVVLFAPTAERVGAIAAQVSAHPDAWMTLDADAARTYARETAGLEVVTAVEALMTRPIERLPPVEAVAVESTGQRGFAGIDVDGRVAATGVVAVEHADAVFDRIETDPAFRRRGLGSRIMNALSGWAFEHGARTGILAASADGQLLYERLGWTVACPLISFPRDRRLTSLRDYVNGLLRQRERHLQEHRDDSLLGVLGHGPLGIAAQDAELVTFRIAEHDPSGSVVLA
ncbi:MAG: GNAT family N-acetyltransferase [Nocardioidaceae bacterium]